MNNKKRSIYLYSGTHWDREWYLPFQGFRYMLVDVMNNLIEDLEADPAYQSFHLDGQTIVLEDFIEVEPDKRQRLQKLITDERVLIGPWYVMPDEFLLSGESLIRNLMMGHEISKQWGVTALKYGYICDIFGHIAQMPQIFNQFSIEYALLGRGTNEHSFKAHFRWQSPDGSECITYKLEDQSGYGAFSNHIVNPVSKLLGSKAEVAKQKRQLVSDYLDKEAERSDIPVILLIDAGDHAPLRKETSEWLQWLRKAFPDDDVKHVNIMEMGKELLPYRNQMPVKQGEINETAKAKAEFVHLITHTLSSRYPLKKWNDQCQSLLEKWIEPMLAWGQFTGFTAQKAYVDLAYKYLIQNHPHDSICGCSIDQVHKDMEYRFAQTEQIGREIADYYMHHERQQYAAVSTVSSVTENRVLAIYNPLPFARSEVITLDVDFPLAYSSRYQEPFGYETINSFKIFDRDGAEHVYSVSSIVRNLKVRRHHSQVDTVDRYRLSLKVDMPAMGKTEYSIKPFAEASRYLSRISQCENEAENELIQLTINRDGSIKIYDKLQGKLYDGLISYLDDGEIGDGWFHVNPIEDQLITSIGAACRIERVENGPLRAVFRVTHSLKVPAGIERDNYGMRRSEQEETLTIISVIGLSIGAAFIDVETTIANRAKDHRVRMKLPTGVDSTIYFVNQPFCFVERKTGIDESTEHWKECEVPEKQMGGIVGKRRGDGSGIAFVSAYGLHECAALNDDRGTINITLFRGFQTTIMTNGELGGQILGDLQFKYAISILQPDTSYADLIRLQDRLQAGMMSFSMPVSTDYQLEESTSILQLGMSNICLSILKRPENGEPNTMVVRLYNMSAYTAVTPLTCIRPIVDAFEVNFNEEKGHPIAFEENSLQIELGPWKIQTYSIKLMK
ncbi:hypothetical protein EHS13_04850 [Paenibacillus psychroresistens]|uniref:Glycoside hydrolase family 38 central domain-containing protein n=1 Tax=Paenibacillus psychroresistens TaxID=1778678 RepID=A0A6B8RDP8_9BACL|nr:glycosyl hydrolase-related protein [Paenibacillus psychroresistens]QGQ94280.1 hypothetical protein EHS13_04850 [Paenibacillus psychroresistens]